MEEGKLRHGENQRKRRGARKMETRARAIAGRREGPGRSLSVDGVRRAVSQRRVLAIESRALPSKPKRVLKEELLF